MLRRFAFEHTETRCTIGYSAATLLPVIGG